MRVAAAHLRRGQTIISPADFPRGTDPEEDGLDQPHYPGASLVVSTREPRFCDLTRTFLALSPSLDRRDDYGGYVDLSVPNDLLIEVV